MDLEFGVKDYKSGVYTGKILEFELPGPVSPEDLPEIETQLPQLSGEGLVISGRGPIWLYAVILHKYMHTFAYVATCDPKVGGAVVVTSHLKSVRIGTVIPISF